MSTKAEIAGQISPRSANIKLLNKLEARYKPPCINYEKKTWTKERIKIDFDFIQLLNQIYYGDISLNQLVILLKDKGFEKRTFNSRGLVYDTITFDKAGKGYLDASISLVYQMNDPYWVAKKIILRTKTNFFCETKEWQSYSYIDFVYLRKFIKKLNIPFHIAGSNVELESY